MYFISSITGFSFPNMEQADPSEYWSKMAFAASAVAAVALGYCVKEIVLKPVNNALAERNIQRAYESFNQGDYSRAEGEAVAALALPFLKANLRADLYIVRALALLYRGYNSKALSVAKTGLRTAHMDPGHRDALLQIKNAVLPHS